MFGLVWTGGIWVGKDAVDMNIILTPSVHYKVSVKMFNALEERCHFSIAVKSMVETERSKDTRWARYSSSRHF